MADSRCVIFYSWQTDLPNATNRGFIERALEQAAKAIKADESIQVEPVIEGDTLGIPGSPDIAETIFGKIAQAQIFVGDISIINQGAISPDGAARPTPNPNVLLELGYALKALGDKRVILVFNDAYGAPELLPFDLKMRRVIRYHMPKDAEERASERKKLEGLLAEGIRVILSGLDALVPGEAIQPLSLTEQARAAIEAERPNQTGLVRQYMTRLAEEITALTPVFADNESDRWDEQLIEALEVSTGLVRETVQLASSIALMDAASAGQAMYKGFGSLLTLYTQPPGYQGNYHPFDHDLAKFLGHELFVSFCACLIQEERWELLADLLSEDLYARGRDFGRMETVSFTELSEPIRLLVHRKERLQSNRMSLHADLLYERHTKGELGAVLPLEPFVEADYFLYLRAQLQPEKASQVIAWLPWSTLNLHQPPRYLLEAVSSRYAQRLLPALSVADIPTLRQRLAERAPNSSRFGAREGAFGTIP